MVTIIPTIFAKNKKEFDERFTKLLPIAKEFQIDFMDGKLLKEKGVAPRHIPTLSKYKKKFEAHLMVATPHTWVKKLKEKGFARVFFHIESQQGKTEQQIRALIKKIQQAHMQAGIVLNPETPIEKIVPFVKDLDIVMFMGHRIGVEKIGVKKSVYTKIQKFKKKFPKTCIEIDGGADKRTIGNFIKIGVQRVSVGSAISDAENPKKELQELQKIGENYSRRKTT